MKRIDILRRAGRSLRQAKVRTLLTSLAIAVGAFTLTISLAAGAGSRDYADKLISSNIDPQALFVAKDESFFDGPQGGGPLSSAGLAEYDPDATTRNGVTVQQFTQDDIDAMRELDELQEVEPIYQVSAKFITFEGNETRYTSDVSTYGAGILTETAAGDLPSRGQQIGANDIVVPFTYLEAIGVETAEEMIGQTVVLTVERSSAQPTEADITQAFLTGGSAAVEQLTRPEQRTFTFTVRAVAKQPATALAATNALQIAPSSAKQIADYLTEGTDNFEKYFAATAVAKDGVDPNDAKQAIADLGFAAQTAEDLQSLIFTIVNILQGIVIGFGIIAIIASVFGIVNTQYISVLERTQQIGLMKALGMSGGDIAKLFRYEAAWIGFLGGFIGAVLAFAIGSSLNPWISDQLSLGEGNYILIFDLLSVGAMLAVLVVIAILAGYFPARKAAKLDPIEALRTE